MGGSICTVVAECAELLALTAVQREGESEAAWQARQARALAEVDGRLLVLFHALVQARAPGFLQGFFTPRRWSERCCSLRALRRACVLTSVLTSAGPRGEKAGTARCGRE